MLWLAAIVPLVWYARYWSMIHRTAIDEWWIPALTGRRAMQIAARFWGLKPLSTFALTIQAPWAMWSGFASERLILFGCLFLSGLGMWNPQARKHIIALVTATGVMLCLLLLSGYLSVPNVLDRTVLPAWGPLVVALGVGAVGGCGKWARAAGGATVIAIATIWAGSWAWTVYQGPPRRPPTAALFARIAHRIAPADLIYTSPRWYKELTVYRLWDEISADQLLDEYESYTGKPPHHRLEPTDPRLWRERFARKIESRRLQHGSDFSVWMVRWATVRPVEPDSPDQFIMSEFRETERYEAFSDWPVAIVRYVPKAGVARGPGPAASATDP
jgi:hypothetical protein